MIFHIVGEETPGLWVDGGETCGVGMHRAVQLERVLAEPGLVKFGFRAALVARELVVVIEPPAVCSPNGS
ncbi:MAG: hypothetical protein HRJ53_29690 [Acidobacteria bacterium Pan2503]|uniref:Uncharacterized protein n=1 Tax=Candidatus Acidiferrum panamense TaxID=2741543 RepID=A0A7V8NX79_9BACT|nr:hypothetical protein [Candidatus Acidoferrum panamensis]